MIWAANYDHEIQEMTRAVIELFVGVQLLESPIAYMHILQFRHKTMNNHVAKASTTFPSQTRFRRICILTITHGFSLIQSDNFAISYQNDSKLGANHIFFRNIS